MYPNPASGEELWIQSAQSIEEVAVYNLAGQQMGRHAMQGPGDCRNANGRL